MASVLPVAGCSCESGCGSRFAVERPRRGIQRDMPGRIKRKLQAAQMERAAEQRLDRVAAVCALCERPLGTRVEWHHLVPKSEGGTMTVPVHPICHRAIHAHVSNRSLATEFAEIAALRERDDLQRFLKWIQGKPADFHAPTSRKRAAD